MEKLTLDPWQEVVEKRSYLIRHQKVMIDRVWQNFMGWRQRFSIVLSRGILTGFLKILCFNYPKKSMSSF